MYAHYKIRVLLEVNITSEETYLKKIKQDNRKVW